MFFIDQTNGKQPTGTKAGTANTRIVGNWDLLNNLDCDLQTNDDLFEGGVEVKICDNSVNRFSRFGFQHIEPDFLNMQFPINWITEDGVNASMVYRKLDTSENLDGYSQLFPTNARYHLKIRNNVGVRNVSYSGTIRDLRPGDYVIIVNDVPEKPDRVFISKQWGEGNEVNNSLTSESANNDWYYDEDANTVEFILKNDNEEVLSRKRRGTGQKFGIKSEEIMNIGFNVKFDKCYWPACIIPEAVNNWSEVPKERPENFYFSSDLKWMGEISTEFGKCKQPVLAGGSRKKRSTDDGPVAPRTVVENGLSQGDNIVIPEGYWIVFDDDLPQLGNVIVYGGLEFKGEEYEMENLLVFGGRVMATDKSGKVRTDPLKLTFHGDYEDDIVALGEELEFGQKGIACMGGCEFIGTGPANPWTILTADISAGDKVLNVEHDVSDWPQGGTIVLASTSMNGLETEHSLTIESVSGNSITLTSGVTFDHRGTAGDDDFQSFRAEVGLVDRSIIIEADSSASTTGHGVRIVGGETLMRHPSDGTPTTFSGTMRFENVQFNMAGQQRYDWQHEDPKWGLVWWSAAPSEVDDLQLVKNSVFYNSYAPGVGVFGCDNIEISGNILHRNSHGGVMFYGGENAKITNNVVIDMWHNVAFLKHFFGESAKISSEPHWPAGFALSNRMTSQDSAKPQGICGDGVCPVDTEVVFSGNRVAGCHTVGIRHPGQACGTPDEKLFKDNTVRGCMYGFMYGPNEFIDDKCVEVKNLDMSHNLIGVWANVRADVERGIPDDPKVTIMDSKIANSLGGATNWFTSGPGAIDHEHVSHVDSRVIFKDLLIVGQDDDFDCKESMDWDRHPMYNSNGKTFYPDKPRLWQYNAFVAGAIDGTPFLDFPEAVPQPGPINEVMGFPSVRGQGVYDGITLKNFGNKCDDSAEEPVLMAFSSDPKKTVDAKGIEVFKGITKINCNCELTKFPVPATSNISPSTCIDMECDAFTTQLFVDTDGSFTGDGTGRGAVLPIREFGWDDPSESARGLGDYRIPKTALTSLNGDRILTEDVCPNKGRVRNDACTKDTDMNAWVCTGADAYEYMRMIVENMDHDTQHRRLGPIAIISERGTNGYVDLYNGPARMSWGERLGLWHTTVAAETTAEFYFTSSPPKHMRIQVHGGMNAGGKVLVKIYNPIPQALEVTKFSNGVETVIESKGDLPLLTDDSGTNYQIRDEQMLYLLMEDNGDHYDIRVTDQVMMAFGFPPVSVDDFFEDKLLENLANFFGIPMSSIRVVNVIREDTVLSRRKRSAGAATGVELEITPDKEDGNSTAAVKEKTNTIVDAVSTGDAGVLGEVMKGTPVESVVDEIKITKLAPIPPSPEEEPEAFEAWSNSITEAISEGKREVAQPVPTVNAIHMNFTVPENIDEDEIFTNLPVVYFTDSDGNTLTAVGNSADPWIVEAVIYSGEVNSTLTLSGDKVWLSSGKAVFNNLAINNVESEEDVYIVFSVVYPIAARAMNLSVTSDSFTVIPLPEPTTTGPYVSTPEPEVEETTPEPVEEETTPEPVEETTAPTEEEDEDDDDSCPESSLGNLIRPDKTIRPYHDPSYCLVHYETRRKSKFYWHKCDVAESKNASMHFVYEQHDDEDFGYMKTVEDDKCLYIRRPENMRRSPSILMRPCKHGNEKLQWEIESNSLFYKLGNGKYCVPFEAEKTARLVRCRWMTLG